MNTHNYESNNPPATRAAGLSSARALAAALAVQAGACCGLALGQPFVFSLDIGSDHASDPNGAHGFDVGDAYIPSTVAWSVLPGADGNWLDDNTIPGLPTRAPTYNAAVPFAAGGRAIASHANFFDLDDLDWVGANLLDYGLGGGVLAEPVYYEDLDPADAELLALMTVGTIAVSFDDDDSWAWSAPYGALGPGVPTKTQSPLRSFTFGTAAGADEVVEYIVAPTGGTPPLAVVGLGLSWDEIGVHADLAADPAGTEVADDDVDALAPLMNQTFVPFCVDHEAHAGLSPSTVYQRRLTPAGAYVRDTLVTAAHLGINASTDIDAIAFAWLEEPATGKDALALLFSVDVNDPRTPGVNESGALNPGAIYASFMTGSSFHLLTPTPPLQGLYGVDRDTDDFYEINRLTGEATVLGTLPNIMHNALAANASREVFYVYGDDLYKVNLFDPALSAPELALTGLDASDEFYALDFDASGTLYGVIWKLHSSGGYYEDYVLVSIDMVTGAVSTVGSLSHTHIQGIGFDPIDDRLYAIDTSDGLVELDKSDASTVAVLGCSGCGAYSYSMTFDSDGALYIADENLLRIEFRGGGVPTYTDIGAIVATEHVHGLASVPASENVDAIMITAPLSSGGGENAPASGQPNLDIDRDNQITPSDFAAFRMLFAAGDQRADLNRDGLINAADLVVWQQSYRSRVK